MSQKAISVFFSNCAYMYNTIWRHDKHFLLVSILQVPLWIANTLLQLYIPKVILDGIENEISVFEYIKRVILIILCMALCQLITSGLNQSIKHGSFKLNLTVFQKKLDLRSLNINYNEFVSPKGKNDQFKAIMSAEGWNGYALKDFHSSIISFVSGVLLLVSYVWILSKLHPIVVLVLCSGNIINLTVAFYINRKVQKCKEQYSTINRKLEYIASISRDMCIAKDMRIYAMNSWIKGISDKIKNEKKFLDKNTSTKRLIQNIIGALLILIRDGVAYFYLISTLFEGGLAVGDFILFLTTIMSFGSCLSSLSSEVERLSGMNYCIKDYRSFVENPSDDMFKSALNLDINNVEIRLEHVSYAYPNSENKVLDDINLTIKSNEKLAIVGVNGAGKTTLIKLICGLLTPDVGEIYINNINIKDISEQEYKKIFSLVLQDISLFPSSLATNITYQKEDKINYKRLNASVKNANFDDIVNQKKYGLQTKLVRQVYDDAVDFSGGELQRLQLSRALYNQDRSGFSVLILDEPTAALDPLAEEKLYKMYDTLTNNQTSIFISHRLASTRFCDRIVLLGDSKIIECGSHQELLSANGTYAKMFTEQRKYYVDEGVK